MCGRRPEGLHSGANVLALYGVSITNADVIMPDGTRLEGRGVTPDALVLPTAADLAAGSDPVLAMALTMAGYPTDAARAPCFHGVVRTGDALGPRHASS